MRTLGTVPVLCWPKCCLSHHLGTGTPSCRDKGSGLSRRDPVWQHPGPRAPQVGLTPHPSLPGTLLVLALKALCPQKPLTPGHSGTIGHPPPSPAQGQKAWPLPPSPSQQSAPPTALGPEKGPRRVPGCELLCDGPCAPPAPALAPAGFPAVLRGRSGPGCREEGEPSVLRALQSAPHLLHQCRACATCQVLEPEQAD